MKYLIVVFIFIPLIANHIEHFSCAYWPSCLFFREDLLKSFANFLGELLSFKSFINSGHKYFTRYMICIYFLHSVSSIFHFLNGTISSTKLFSFDVIQFIYFFLWLLMFSMFLLTFLSQSHGFFFFFCPCFLLRVFHSIISYL